MRKENQVVTACLAKFEDTNKKMDFHKQENSLPFLNFERIFVFFDSLHFGGLYQAQVYLDFGLWFHKVLARFIC